MNKLYKFIIIFFLTLGLYSIFSNTKPSNTEPFDNDCQSCKTPKLLPILDPLYNMREFCKQSVLLEDHLTQKQKTCKDCITKHSLAMEALAEEASTLDKKGEYSNILDSLPDKCRKLQKDFINGSNPHTIAQNYRQIRKQLQPLCYEHF